MPELPDVQVFRQLLQRHGLNRTVATVGVRADGMLEDVSGSTLRKALRGRCLETTRRHGKHLFARIDSERGRWLHLHFGMTGRLVHLAGGEDEPDHVRLRLDFEDGDGLAFRCPRKLGRIGLVQDPAAFARDRGLGPDPLVGGFGLRDFRERLEGRSGTLKGILMNQAVLAGLGNLYTDEALFQAGWHPGSATDALSDDAVAEVWRAVKKVLEKAVDYRVDAGRMPSTWLLPNREEGADCPRCEGALRKTRISGRTTLYCDRHQRRAG